MVLHLPEHVATRSGRRVAPRHPPTARTSSAPDDDAVLMGSVAAGDLVAFAELYDRFGRRAYSLACHLCRDPGLAEDVVQEAFTIIWRDRGRFDRTRGSVGGWLLTLLHHKAVDAVRREAGKRRVERGGLGATRPSAVGGPALEFPGCDRC